MSPVVTEILQQIDRLSPIEQAQILQHLTQQTEKSTEKSSKLDRFTELLQAEGCYEDDYIQQSMVELETKS
jgi:mannitol/fructose-specific phosphotransferase system IIA component